MCSIEIQDKDVFLEMKQALIEGYEMLLNIQQDGSKAQQTQNLQLKKQEMPQKMERTGRQGQSGVGSAISVMNPNAFVEERF